MIKLATIITDVKETIIMLTSIKHKFFKKLWSGFSYIMLKLTKDVNWVAYILATYTAIHSFS